MKKIIFSLFIFLFGICNINALTIESMLIDAETEIAGGIKVRELVRVKDQSEPITLKVYYTDIDAKEFNSDKESLYGSKIYNGTSVYVAKVGLVKEGADLEKYIEPDFYENNVTDTKHEEVENKGYMNITLSDTGDNTYYLDYTITNVLVEHEDCAELYYKYIDNLEYDVNQITIVMNLPSSSELFKVWAHGDNKTKVTIDNEKSIVKNIITNYKKGTYLDNRILFDKSLFSININQDKKSNMKAIEMITSIEEERLNNSSTANTLKIVFLSGIGVLVLLIIAYIVYTIISKKKKKK